MKRSFHQRGVPSATLDYLEEHRCKFGEALRDSGHLTLATIARNPATIVAINRARDVADKGRWWELCHQWHPTADELAAAKAVLSTMPGYCCLNDAANLAARV